MKILFLCSEYVQPTSPLGGIFFRDQAVALRDSGHQIEVAYVEPRSLKTLSLAALLHQRFQIRDGYEDGVYTLRQLGWNLSPYGLYGRSYSILTARLAEYYIRNRGAPDLIHVHCALWAGLAAVTIKRKYGIPYVITEHHSTVLTPQPAAAEKAMRESYMNSNRVISVSRHLASAMMDRVINREIEIVPNIVDTDYFSPEISPMSQGKGPRIAAVGNLDSNKSHDHLLSAFAKVRTSLPFARLTIAGDGPRREELIQLASRLSINDSVRFLGLIGRDDVRNLLRDSDMLVHTSQYETFGVVLIEAGAVGIPVIATACGGPKEIVVSDTGVLVPIGDIGAIENAIHDVWSRPWESTRIRQRTIDLYGRQSVVQKLTAIYESVGST